MPTNSAADIVIAASVIAFWPKLLKEDRVDQKILKQILSFAAFWTPRWLPGAGTARTCWFTGGHCEGHHLGLIRISAPAFDPVILSLTGLRKEAHLELVRKRDQENFALNRPLPLGSRYHHRV
jgi:hypothetical protein